MTMSSEGSLSCHTYFDTGHPFIMVISEDTSSCIYTIYRYCSFGNYTNISYKENLKKTICVCETQMPPIIANAKDGQGHKDKYLDNSRKVGFFYKKCSCAILKL